MQSPHDECSWQSIAVIHKSVNLRSGVQKNNGLRTEQIAGPNRSCAQAGSDMSSGGSGTIVTPASRRAAIQTHIDFRDIKTCRRVLLVRARFRRSIGSNADNIYGGD
jgi:hypothetical protein